MRVGGEVCSHAMSILLLRLQGHEPFIFLNSISSAFFPQLIVIQLLLFCVFRQ